jgi:glycosyltransferase involved in cell wall biosynthesis
MDASVDLVCISHLPWDFVFQRPNHLMSRCARERRTFFFEEPVVGRGAGLTVRTIGEDLFNAVPHLPQAVTEAEAAALQRGLLDGLLRDYRVRRFVLWLYTPMALPFSRHLDPVCTVYDCMDELSAFQGAPPALRRQEHELFRRADLVFTGGVSLFEAKRDLHPSVHAFPSSVDAAHFRAARRGLGDPPDQAPIGGPRLGFFGVIDERMDLELVARLADARPRWNLVMVGPVAKIDPRTLPRRPNIHYLGQKRYEDLPAYLSGWDAALMPFALNASTRFISPTKTLEYLAAGKPVISTAIQDVVRPYGERGLVRVADQATFVEAVEAALAEEPGRRQAAADALIAQTSWERTWARMSRLISAAIDHKSREGEGERTCSII